jgi:hypothetical protein
MPYKIWSVNEILTAADMNTYIGNQTVLAFPGTAARTSAIGTPVDGMFSYVGGGTVEVYVGGTVNAWTELGAPASLGDIGDVTISSATSGEVLQWSGTAWINGPSPRIFAGTAARGSAIPSPTEGMLTYLSDVDGLTVYNGSNWVPAASGATLGAGTILQVVNTIKTDVFSTSSATPVDVTGYSVTITPRAATSKILVLVEPFFGGSENAVGLAIKARLLRGATVIAGAGGSEFHNTESGDRVAYPHPLSFLDSPNTTSAVTYKVQMSAAAGTVYLNRTRNISTASSSTITVMEVAG